MPRDLLLAVRGELRAWSAHWAQGFNALGESLVKHDKRMQDGKCATCALLELLDVHLYPPPPPVPVAVQIHLNEPPPAPGRGCVSPW